MQIPSKKNIIIFVAIFIAAFIGYTFFFKGSGVPASLTTEKPLLAQSDVKGKDLLRVLLSLNNIKLDEEIFSSELFTSLEDFTIALPETGPSGRKNPFAPIGKEGESGPKATPTKVIK